jgi:alanine racemase
MEIIDESFPPKSLKERTPPLLPSSHEKPHISSRAIVEISQKALLHNYALIQKKIPHQLMLPMIKADGYGHGLTWVTQTLYQEKNLYGFGVATLEEGALIRKVLDSFQSPLPIFIFSGASFWGEEKGSFCQKFRLTPIIVSWEDWKTFSANGWHRKLEYQIKFNTGMNRLGLPLETASEICKELSNEKESHHPTGILTHLACAESPNDELSLLQLKNFKKLKHSFKSLLSHKDSRRPLHFHLANSAAIWKHENWELETLSSVVRPGLALYGIPPWPGLDATGLIPALSFKAQVITTHMLEKGDRVGYSGTFRAPHQMKVATVAAGYGDGLLRHLSNCGEAWIDKKKEEILGAISMDLCAVTCSDKTKTGDWVEFFGPHIEPWKQSLAAKTIPYELLTSITARVERIYAE